MKPTTEVGLAVLDRWAASRQPFTANDVRADLDAAEVPLRSRPRLFQTATAIGVLTMLPGATRSTNRASRGDHVARYIGARIATPALPRTQPRDGHGRFNRPGQPTLFGA